MPNQKKVDNILQLFNEITVLVVNYHLFCFTRFVEIETQIYIANSVIIVVMANISLTLLVIFSEISSQFVRYIKKKYVTSRQSRKVTIKRGHIVSRSES